MINNYDYSFNAIPRANIARSTFRRDFDEVTTCDGGYLVPFYVDEVLPGDTHNLDLSIFGRLTTPVVPVMDKIFIDTFFFFVPNRIVWDNWERFQGAQDNPGDSIDYLVPQLEAPEGGWPTGSVADYLGIPTNIPNSPPVDSLVFRAINLIYNEWFRDENLQDSLPVPKGDGPDTWFQLDSEGNVKRDADGNPLLTYPLSRRGKRHDYFTSALPWPLKNGESVSVPIGTTAPVIGNGNALGYTNGSVTAYDTSYASSGVWASSKQTTTDGSAPAVGSAWTGANAGSDSYWGVSPDPEKSGLIANLEDVTAVDVQTLREAMLLQMFLERSARTGTRYIEILRGLWNVISPDYRLQRPELLGGSIGEMSITTVPQTSATSSVSPQGNLTAFGVYSDGRHGFTKSFTEHGHIIGFINVRTRLKYQQGLDRMWTRRTRYDFAYPQFAHLGEQPVLLQEIYMQGTDVLDENGEPMNESVFGYQERYAEYRYKNSIVTGKMRSSDPQSLDVWHLAQYFESAPRLSSEFIEDRPPFERILAVQDEPQFKFDIKGYLNSVRALPVHGVPGFMPYL